MTHYNLSEFPLWTALVTPFNDTGEVNYDDLKHLLRLQEQAQNGILILGSTGEALNLDLQTRKEIIEFSCSLDLEVPIMVGVGGSLLNETIDWVRWLETQAVDSLLMVTPHYAKPGRRGQTDWFSRLLDSTTKPTVLYNVPGRSATDLHLDTVRDLLPHPNFYGVKESSGSANKFSEYIEAAEGKIMYCGDDALMPEFSSLGAQGLISVAANAWPSATHEYVQQNLLGIFQDKALWRGASDALFCASNPIPVKKLLAHNQIIQSAYLQPPLHQDDLSDLSQLLNYDAKIQNWNIKYCSAA